MKKDLKEFKTFPSSTIKEIQRAAKEGIYQIRGLGAKRKVPDFDDLVFLGASMSRYPLEGYREKCNTSVILGDRFAKNPIKLRYTNYYCWNEFWSFRCQCKGSFRQRCFCYGNFDNHWRWRHDKRRKRIF